MEINRAPIVLFTYRRLEHTRRTLSALAENDGARDSTIYIYSDAAKDNTAASDVAAVRAYLKTVGGFAEVQVIERERNWGLADSIVDGVGTVVKKHGRVIVLEDDIMTAQHFLNYMNEALNLYADTPEVMHVSGFFYPVTDTQATSLPETFFYNQATCWGWGTWERAWRHYRDDAAELLNDIKAEKRLHEFDMDGNFRFSSTLRANASGKMRTWAIKWHASVFLRHGLCLHPRYSLVKNIGHDGSGEHGSTNSRYDDPNFIIQRTVTVKKQSLIELPTARRIVTNFLRGLRPSLLDRCKQLIGI